MDSLFGSSLSLAAIALVAVNLASFAAFGIDKRLAESRDRRISEATLLQLAFFGGSLGAYAGRHMFRHKTRKQPFSDQLFHIVVLQVMAVSGGAAWVLSG